MCTATSLCNNSSILIYAFATAGFLLHETISVMSRQLGALNCCRFVAYCMKRVDLLQRAGVTPVIVFDGGRLPMKGDEEAFRARHATA